MYIPHVLNNSEKENMNVTTSTDRAERWIYLCTATLLYLVLSTCTGDD